MDWIIFAILAPFFYAVSAMFDKFLIDKKIRDPIIMAISGGILVFFMGLLIFSARGFAPLDWRSAMILIGGGVLTQIGLVPYFKAISLDNVSRVMPIFQIAPIFVLTWSYFLLGETLTIGQLAGFALILAGSLLISVKKVDFGELKLRRAFWWALLTCVIFSFPSVMFKFVAIDLVFWDALVYDYFGVLAGAIILAIFYRKRIFFQMRGLVKNVWSVLFVNELIYWLGGLCATYAVFSGSVALTSVINGFLPVFVFVFGIILSIYFPRIIKEYIAVKTLVLKITALILMIGGLLMVNV